MDDDDLVLDALRERIRHHASEGRCPHMLYTTGASGTRPAGRYRRRRVPVQIHTAFSRSSCGLTSLLELDLVPNARG